MASRLTRSNDGTVIGGPPPNTRAPLFRTDPDGLQRVLDDVGAWRRENPEGSALAVLVKTSAGVTFHTRTTTTAEPCALILGRHSECDVDVGERANEALRHAAIVLWPHPAQNVSVDPAVPIVDVIDLRTAGGIVLRDGRSVRRATRSHVFSFASASADVIAMGAGPDCLFPRFADELDALLTKVLRQDELIELQSPRSPADEADRAVSFNCAGRSMPSREIVSRVVERSMVFRPGPDAPIERAAGQSGTARTGRIVAPARPREPARDPLVLVASVRGLEAGLIVGRYARCDRTAAIEEGSGVSRVHALLAFGPQQDEHSIPRLYVIDTASTSGTYIIVDGEELELDAARRIAPLPPNGRLMLGTVELQIQLEA